MSYPTWVYELVDVPTQREVARWANSKHGKFVVRSNCDSGFCGD